MANKDQVDFEEKNALGGLDRLVTNVGLAIICVFPSLFSALFMPWRLIPLMKDDDPDGRKGVILSPGAFFVLGLAVVLIIAAALTTDAVLSGNGSIIGPILAVDVAAAASEGNLWKMISIITPLYVLTLVIGVLGAILRPWVGDWWTLRVSFRAGLYFLTTWVSWVLLWSVVIEYVKIQSNNHALGNILYSVISVAMVPLALWIYFWFFKAGGGFSIKKSGALSIAMTLLLFCLAFMFQLFSSFF